MVLAYRVIMTAYGFWLPNDPRRSWSEVVRAREIFRFGGDATKVTSTRSVAHKRHDRAKRLEVKKHLARAAVAFSGTQARAIANGFADYCRRSGLIVYACSILPKHAHLVVGRHTFAVEKVARLLKSAATTALLNAELHPFRDEPYGDRQCPSLWARGQWAVFLDSSADIIRSIKYVNENPLREGHRAQHWKFVATYGEAR